MRTAEEEATNLDIEVAAILTPMTPHAARGKTADRTVELGPELAPEWRERLYAEAWPAIVTSTRR